MIIIIAIMAAALLGALAKTREAARADATKATIAKLNDLVMRRYESYMTRRVPLDLSGMTPRRRREIRLNAIRDLMRMEMPERWNDVIERSHRESLRARVPAAAGPAQSTRPSTGAKQAGPDHAMAKCLYMWVMTSIPDAKTMFTSREMAIVDSDGWTCFIDGWGRPISFLRWAPGYSPNSDIQVADPAGHQIRLITATLTRRLTSCFR